MKAAEEMTPEQFEQAKRELLEKHKFGYQEYVDFVESEFNSLLEQHKEVMLREELIAYDKFLSNTYWGISHITKREEAVDEYLKSREK